MLPEARAVPADCIATMLQHGIRHGGMSHAAPLLRLPGAKQIASKPLCGMFLAAARAGTFELMLELGR
jgi:hypothetical protein